MGFLTPKPRKRPQDRKGTLATSAGSSPSKDAPKLSGIAELPSDAAGKGSTEMTSLRLSKGRGKGGQIDSDGDLNV